MAQLAVEVAKLELALTKSSDHNVGAIKGNSAQLHRVYLPEAEHSSQFIDSMEVIYRRSDQDYDSEHKERESGIIMGENGVQNWNIFTFYSVNWGFIFDQTRCDCRQQTRLFQWVLFCSFRVWMTWQLRLS